MITMHSLNKIQTYSFCVNKRNAYVIRLIKLLYLTLCWDTVCLYRSLGWTISKRYYLRGGCVIHYQCSQAFSTQSGIIFYFFLCSSFSYFFLFEFLLRNAITFLQQLVSLFSFCFFYTFCMYDQFYLSKNTNFSKAVNISWNKRDSFTNSFIVISVVFYSVIMLYSTYWMLI
eukprot:375243_1